jgi:hypothetical protein
MGVVARCNDGVMKGCHAAVYRPIGHAVRRRCMAVTGVDGVGVGGWWRSAVVGRRGVVANGE